MNFELKTLHRPPLFRTNRDLLILLVPEGSPQAMPCPSWLPPRSSRGDLELKPASICAVCAGRDGGAQAGAAGLRQGVTPGACQAAAGAWGYAESAPQARSAGVCHGL